MDILIGYRVGAYMDSILYNYWEHLLIVARAGHYYSSPFKGYIGFPQVGPLSTTIFNMV